MSRMTLIASLVFISVLDFSSPALSQELPRQGLYTLVPKNAAYQFGCFGPACLCPIAMVQGLTGTFVLEERGEEDGFFVFDVREASFIAPTNPPTFLGGDGVYRVLVDGGISHEMRLALFFAGGGPARRRFKSPITERDPDTRDIVISSVWRDGTCEGAQIDLFAEWTPVEPLFVRGDCNDDDNIDLSDVVCTLNWLFLGGEMPGCAASVNTNGDRQVDLSDPVSLLNFLFLGGPLPAVPFPDCGTSELPSDAELGCIASSCP